MPEKNLFEALQIVNHTEEDEKPSVEQQKF